MAAEEKTTSGSGNVFADLGFQEPDRMLVRAELAHRINTIIKKRHLTQARAAKVLGVAQPKVSNLLNGHLKDFSTERLLRFLLALDRDVEIRIKKKPASRKHARVRVSTA